jgi:hypothetical protein
MTAAVMALVAFGVPGRPALAVAAATPDVTPPMGPFGFTTMGLGQTATYGEPSLAIADDGRHLLVSTPGGGGTNNWYSANDGLTWGTSHTPYGGGDSALDFLHDGTALVEDLHVTNANGSPPDSGVRVSHDYGKTWGPVAHAGIEQDRAWFAHSPDNKTLYLVYHDFVLEAEFISVSTDGGVTWTNTPVNQIPVNSTGQGTALPILLGGHSGTPASILDQGVNTFSGPMLVDPNGKDLYVVYSISDFVSNANPQTGVPPYGPVRALVLAHSADAGATWTDTLADVPDGTATSESIEGTFFPWGFLDANGTVYLTFDSTRGGAPGDHFHRYYIYSKDKGATWSKPFKIDTLAIGNGSTTYSTGDSPAPGVIDTAWYESATGSPSQDTSTWTPHFAQVTGADTDHPKVVEQTITTIPNHKGGICLQGILCGIGPGSKDRSLADFFMVKINPITHLAEIAYADNNRLGGGKGEVVVAHQTILNPAASTATGGRTVPLPNTAPAGPNPLSLLPAAAITLLGGALVVGRRRRGGPHRGPS